jgi:hypothetical protein
MSLCVFCMQVSLRLDISRNDLLLATTAIDILACSVAFGAYITGIFGMNLDNTITIQTRRYGFLVVTVASFVIIVILFMSAFAYLKKAGILPSRNVENKNLKPLDQLPMMGMGNSGRYRRKRKSIF